jgi:hypothetical protein
MLAALSVARLSRRNDRAALIILSCALVLNVAISALVVVKAPYQPEQLRQRVQNYTDVMEYHPRWWDEQRHPEFDETPVIVQAGDATVKAIDDIGTSQTYEVDARVKSILALRTLYFPGWVARVDGRTVRTSPANGGHMELTVEPGDKSLSLTLEDTTARRWGRIASAGGLVIWLATAVFAVRLHRNRRLPGAAESAQVASEVKADRKKTVSSKVKRRRK